MSGGGSCGKVNGKVAQNNIYVRQERVRTLQNCMPEISVGNLQVTRTLFMHRLLLERMAPLQKSHAQPFETNVGSTKEHF